MWLFPMILSPFQHRIVEDYSIKIKKEKVLVFTKILRNVIVSFICDNDQILIHFNDIVRENIDNFRKFFEDLIDVNP